MVLHSLEDEITDQASTGNTDEHWNWKGAGRKTKAYTTDEDHGFKSFSEDGDEGQHEHSILLAESLELGACATLADVFCFKCFRKLDTPLVLQLRNTQQCGAHQGDNH